jgi:hypothetical protein
LAGDGRRLITELDAQGFGVAAAGWVKTADDGRPYLYIVPRVPVEAPYHGYKAIQPILRTLPDARISLMDIKVINPDHPLGRGIVWTANRFPGPGPTWSYGPDLGGVPIDEPAYIYAPTPVPTA